MRVNPDSGLAWTISNGDDLEIFGPTRERDSEAVPDLFPGNGSTNGGGDGDAAARRIGLITADKTPGLHLTSLILQLHNRTEAHIVELRHVGEVDDHNRLDLAAQVAEPGVDVSQPSLAVGVGR